MSSLAVKRINADIKNIMRSQLSNQNIYVWTNDENIYNMRVLIIGPEIENSPYQNGFYLFEVEIPKDYPLSPPLFKFVTTDGRVRFNPNLYTNGKVCLSILNTWHGPGWTSASTLGMVLLSLQSILHEHPIQNEPGYEKEDGIKSKNYNNVLSYYNIKLATMGMIKNPPLGYEVFKDIMINYFVKNINKYIKFTDELIKYDGLTLSSGIYHMRIYKYDICKLHEKMMDLYSSFSHIEIENDK